MDSGFHVYLTSNVAPNIFASNNPSKFSTLLAKEINLDGSGWEVGVRNIMYPSHVKSATEDDKIFIYKHKDKYREILPIPDRKAYKKDQPLANVGSNIIIQIPTGKKDLPEAIVTLLNENVFAKKGVFKVEYRKDLKKFIFHCHKEDIVILFSPDTQRFFGFSNAVYTKGSHWAWSAFNPNNHKTLKTLEFGLFDLQVLSKNEYHLKRSYELNMSVKNAKARYEATVPYRFKNWADDDLLYEPTFTVSVIPQEGKIKFITRKGYPKELEKDEERVLLFRFDDASRKAFNLQPIYVKNFGMELDFTPIKENKDIEDIRSMYVTLYFGSIRELDDGPAEEAIATISIDSELPFKQPTDFLPKLNQLSNKYKYSFDFDESRQRFTLSTGETYFLRMSKSLSSILGFDSSHLTNFTLDPESVITASHFPVINRAITTLYVYTNIVNDVNVGDVLAPLLLTCPFKKDDTNDVIQMEFMQPIYTSLNRNQFQQIDIQIYDEAGSLVPFVFGKTVLTLHFRKQSSFI